MKPKDLKAPFTFAKRRPLLERGVFYVPTYYDDYGAFKLPPWKELFGNENPVHIEYCSGNGEWIVDKAQESPGINWIANELRFDRVRKIFSKMANKNVQNLFIVCGMAQNFTREYLQDSSIDAVYVNFPDPWPKDRHAKHRLIQDPFVSELKRVVKPEGTALFVSDHVHYIGQMSAEMERFPEWNAQEVQEEYKNSYGTSYFERLWRSRGLNIHFLKYRNAKL